MISKSLPLALALSVPILLCACQGPDLVSSPAVGVAAPDEAQTAAMLARMIELGTPGAEHALLDALTGTFDAEVSMWNAPGLEPEIMTGTMVNSWILGGRFVQSDYSSEWMGQPFHGLGLFGYDKAQDAYVGTWCDTASTMLAPVGTGQLSEDGTQIVTYKEMVDPTSGLLNQMREVLTFVSEDHHRMEMYISFEGQEEFLMMRIEYVRTR
jgi:hypothetical protein